MIVTHPYINQNIINKFYKGSRAYRLSVVETVFFIRLIFVTFFAYTGERLSRWADAEARATTGVKLDYKPTRIRFNTPLIGSIIFLVISIIWTLIYYLPFLT